MSDFLDRLFAGEREAILLTAAAYFALMGVLSIVHMIHLSLWPSVVGELLSEQVERTGLSAYSPDELEYKAAVRYSYVVDGVHYESDRLNPWLVTATYNLRSLLKLQFKGIKKHGRSRVTVYYYPRNPQKAYLDVPGWVSITFVSVLCFGSAVLIYSAL